MRVQKLRTAGGGLCRERGYLNRRPLSRSPNNWRQRKSCCDSFVKLTAATSSSFGSGLTSLLLPTALVAALFPNIPMMPFCGLVGGFSSPFMTVFFCSGSTAGARLMSLASCSSTDDIGTALTQRMALYLQLERDRVLTLCLLNKSLIKLTLKTF